MNAKDVLLPTDGNGKVKFLAYAKLWPVIPAFILFVVWGSKRMETGEEKLVRINATIQPIADMLSRWDAQGGHPAVVARVEGVEKMMAERHVFMMEARKVHAAIQSDIRLIMHEMAIQPGATP